ncbi:MAG: hypothetical protein ACFE96_09705 [Candidatus Hermodarchaeota archaeon]
MREYKINEFLSLKLEEGRTHIYVNGNKFIQCKRLAINIPNQDVPMYDNIDSIDEAADLYQKYLYQNKIIIGELPLIERDHVHDITPEQEFWGHCSNIQTWYEYNYDTRLLHSNLAFYLLKALVDAGDPDAIRVFKKEITERFESGHLNTIIYILKTRLIDYFNLEEKKQLIHRNFPVILEYIEKISEHNPNIFPYIFRERLLDYLTPEEKRQLLLLNYPVVLKYIQDISRLRYYSKNVQYIFDEILFDCLSPEEIKQLIHHHFPIILKDIEKIWKHYPNMFLYLFEEKLLKYLSEAEKRFLIQQNYPIILKYIQKISKDDPEKFFYIFDKGILDHLPPEEKSQLLKQNYLIIFKNLQEILSPEIAEFEYFYPKKVMDLFEARLFDYLSSEEKKQLIQENFPILLICIQRISHTTNIRRFSQENLNYIYLIMIDAIKGTKFLDEFFSTIVENFLYPVPFLKIISAVAAAAKKVSKISPEDSSKILEVFWKISAKWREQRREELKSLYPSLTVCKACGKNLTLKSKITLKTKRRVYCPNCGRLVQREPNRRAVLEEIREYFKIKNE